MKQPLQFALAGLVGAVVGYLLPLPDQAPPPAPPIDAAPVPVLPPVLTPIDDRPVLTPIAPVCPEYKVLSDAEAWARMAPEAPR